MSRFRGSIDVPLNQAGREQSHVAAQCLFDVATVVHDWQSRTRETAEIIADYHKADLRQYDTCSQRLGWLEGVEVNETSLELMRYYQRHPTVVPHPAFSDESKSPESFGAWLNRWFQFYDVIAKLAEFYNERWVIVTHNRNIQAILSRTANWINWDSYDVEGPRPCSISHVTPNLCLVRHGETSFGG